VLRVQVVVLFRGERRICRGNVYLQLVNEGLRSLWEARCGKVNHLDAEGVAQLRHTAFHLSPQDGQTEMVATVPGDLVFGVQKQVKRMECHSSHGV